MGDVHLFASAMHQETKTIQKPEFIPCTDKDKQKKIQKPQFRNKDNSGTKIVCVKVRINNFTLPEFTINKNVNEGQPNNIPSQF